METTETDVGGRLARLRERMGAAGLDALLVRSTDRYLNEYVPAADSLRVWLSGFTGSVGDVVVTSEQAFVFVDGRYHLQAERETDGRLYHVVKVPFGTTIEEAVERRLVELAAKHGAGYRVGFEPETVPVELHGRLEQALARPGAVLVATADNLVRAVRGPVSPHPPSRLEPVDVAATGETVMSRLARVREALASAGADGALVTRLDEIAWLTNLRAYELDHASTFRAVAHIGREQATLFVDPAKVSDDARASLAGAFELAPEDGWEAALARRPGAARGRILLDPDGSTVAHRAALERAAGGAAIVLAPSPLQALKARKSPAELAAMTDGYHRADAVVAEAARWLNREVAKGRAVTEKALALEVERRFREAGARALSFRVIAAAGASGAVIHYSHPDPERRIRKGELVLLDTGAYFEPGYATDLTRTFLAGGASARPTDRQRRVFTLVLKGAIRGMKARFPQGTTGAQLDAIVRAPIWEAGHDFQHGTGHGVGILVHEFPPRVSTRSLVALEPGMVFSIEPGIYIPGWGGVRIENLVTVVADPKEEGFLRVKVLTFSPLDRRLIDGRMLALDEKQWLRQYHRGRAW